jgi:hypothetical protein
MDFLLVALCSHLGIRYELLAVKRIYFVGLATWRYKKTLSEAEHDSVVEIRPVVTPEYCEVAIPRERSSACEAEAESDHNDQLDLGHSTWHSPRCVKMHAIG